MAVQFHVARSAVVAGAGALGGGPYHCAQGSVWVAYYNCMTPGAWTPLPAVALLKSETDTLARAGAIDPTSNLNRGKAWLFSGTHDATVKPEVVKALAAYYAAYGVKAQLVDDKPAGHAMVTQNAGNACASTAPPYINNCGYDAAGELLKHLLGPLRPKLPAGNLKHFSQEEFTSGEAKAIGMAAEGLVYIPKACAGGGCRIHVAFHGCRQNAEAIGDRFAREAGYNEWAEANRLIVLYPQTTARYFPMFNPRACWDWWGYTGPLYHTRDGSQVRAVQAMIERLASAPK